MNLRIRTPFYIFLLNSDYVAARSFPSAAITDIVNTRSESSPLRQSARLLNRASGEQHPISLFSSFSPYRRILFTNLRLEGGGGGGGGGLEN